MRSHQTANHSRAVPSAGRPLDLGTLGKPAETLGKTRRASVRYGGASCTSGEDSRPRHFVRELAVLLVRYSVSVSIEFVDEATRALARWLERVVPDVEVVIGSNRETQCPEGIVVRLLQVAPANRPRLPGYSIELSVHYDVSVRLADTLAEQRALGEIVFAAVAGTDYQVGLAGQSGGPGIVLMTKVARLRDITPSRPVHRVRTEFQVVRALEGGVAVDTTRDSAITIQLPVET
jgi:hypothetical protein